MENVNFSTPSPENIDLAQFDGEYGDMEVENREFETVPDGRYQVVVDRVEITTSKTSGNAMLRWGLKIIAPQFVGRLLWRNNMLVTRENIRWLKGDLELCGLKLQKISDLPANLGKLLDVRIEVAKKTQGEFQNIFFNKRLDLDGGKDDYEKGKEEALAAF